MTNRLAAIDFITRCLRVRATSAEIEALGREIDSGVVPWGAVICLANSHFLSPTLWATLDEFGLADRMPDDILDYLKQLYALNVQRNVNLYAQLVDIANLLNAGEVEPLILKGAATLFTETYRWPGARIMTDLDVLVPRERAMECYRQLNAAGYTADDDGFERYAHHHHLPPLYRKDNYASLELHHELVLPVKTGRIFGVKLRSEWVSRITDHLRTEAVSICVGESRMRLPSPTFRLLHLILHSALQDREHRDGSMPLRALHESALMLDVHRDEVDLNLVSQLFGDVAIEGVSNDWLYMANRLYRCALPQGMQGGLRAASHYLRCRLQARWGVRGSFLAFASLSPKAIIDPRMRCIP